MPPPGPPARLLAGSVDTQKGVVTLKGNVETEAQKNEAEQIARETDGVSKVVNNLVVGGR